MLVWTDSRGRSFSAKLNLSIVRKILAATGIDLLHATDDNLKIYRQVTEDVAILANVMYLIAVANGFAGPKGEPLTEEIFWEGIDGESLDRMNEAFTESIADFSPAQKRALIKLMIEKGKLHQEKMMVKASVKADQALDLLLKRIDEMTDAEIEARCLPAELTAGSLSGNMAGSSASTRVH
jgi:hypothetical protein